MWVNCARIKYNDLVTPRACYTLRVPASFWSESDTHTRNWFFIGGNLTAATDAFETRLYGELQSIVLQVKLMNEECVHRFERYFFEWQFTSTRPSLDNYLLVKDRTQDVVYELIDYMEKVLQPYVLNGFKEVKVEERLDVLREPWAPFVPDGTPL
jgi:hypothetical protein